jgi:transcriptional regulator with XRE-family HTH domain
MTNTENKGQKIVHHGRNIKRFREMFGWKQEALALELGPDWSQKKVSRLEENEIVEEDVLLQVAAVLKVPVEAIKHFDEQAAVQIISNTFNDESSAYTINYKCAINPMDTILSLVDENKKLYEQLLASEREKVALLQRLLDEQK